MSSHVTIKCISLSPFKYISLLSSYVFLCHLVVKFGNNAQWRHLAAKSVWLNFPFLSQLGGSSQRRLSEAMDIDHVKIDLNDDRKAHKCNQCEFTSSWVGVLRRHLKIHSGEKSNKCTQCDYASSQASHMRTHMKTHSGEKSNKYNQCDFASSQTGNFRTRWKTHNGLKSNECNQCDYASS